MRNRTRSVGTSWLRGTLVVACLSVFGLLAAAPSAQASDEFETAFKYELGRIAAHEAASVAVHVLGAAYPYPPRYPYYGGYPAYPPYYKHRRPRHPGRAQGHGYGHRGHGRGHRKHGCDHY